MTRYEIIEFLKSHKTEIEQRFGVTKLGLAGSYARDEAKNESDIDIIELNEYNLVQIPARFCALEV